jgi:hypothetical protein
MEANTRKAANDIGGIINSVRSVYPDALAVTNRFATGFDLRETILPESYTIMIGNRSSDTILNDWREYLFTWYEISHMEDAHRISKWDDSIDLAWEDALNSITLKILRTLES